jgi:DNA-binding GntR family transcriptional regulator
MMTRYEHVARELRKLIHDGEWPEGQRIPPEPDLCERFHVSRTTIRQAVQILSSEGLLLCRQGLGTFVLKPETSRRPIGLTDFSNQVLQGQIHLQREIISSEVVAATEEQAHALKVPTGSPLKIVQRMDRMDHQPISIDECLIPMPFADRVAEQDFADPLFFYKWMERQQLKIVRNEQSIQTEPATADDCKYLGLVESIWMLVLTETFFDNEGVIVGRIVTRYRGDTSRLTTSISER